MTQQRSTVEVLGLCVRAVNDYEGHAAVLARYDRAIERAEAEAQS